MKVGNDIYINNDDDAADAEVLDPKTELVSVQNMSDEEHEAKISKSMPMLKCFTVKHGIAVK